MPICFIHIAIFLKTTQGTYLLHTNYPLKRQVSCAPGVHQIKADLKALNLYPARWSNQVIIIRPEPTWIELGQISDTAYLDILLGLIKICCILPIKTIKLL